MRVEQVSISEEIHTHINISYSVAILAQAISRIHSHLEDHICAARVVGPGGSSSELFEQARAAASEGCSDITAAPSSSSRHVPLGQTQVGDMVHSKNPYAYSAAVIWTGVRLQRRGDLDAFLGVWELPAAAGVSTAPRMSSASPRCSHVGYGQV